MLVAEGDLDLTEANTCGSEAARTCRQSTERTSLSYAAQTEDGESLGDQRGPAAIFGTTACPREPERLEELVQLGVYSQLKPLVRAAKKAAQARDEDPQLLRPPHHELDERIDQRSRRRLKRIANGFRNKNNFRTAIFFHHGGPRLVRYRLPTMKTQKGQNVGVSSAYGTPSFSIPKSLAVETFATRSFLPAFHRKSSRVSCARCRPSFRLRWRVVRQPGGGRDCGCLVSANGSAMCWLSSR